METNTLPSNRETTSPFSFGGQLRWWPEAKRALMVASAYFMLRRSISARLLNGSIELLMRGLKLMSSERSSLSKQMNSE